MKFGLFGPGRAADPSRLAPFIHQVRRHAAAKVLHRSFLAALLLAPAVSAFGESQHWHADASGNRLEFSAWYDGQELTGRIGRFVVDVDVDDNGAPILLSVQAETGSADMNDDEINAELAEPDWFDVAHFPVSTFQSRDIQMTGSGYLADGALKIKNISRSLKLPFAWQVEGNEARLTGTVRLDHGDWQVGSGEWADDPRLAAEVEVRYKVTLRRAD